jgi:hypothetical protein
MFFARASVAFEVLSEEPHFAPAVRSNFTCESRVVSLAFPAATVVTARLVELPG